MGSYCGNCFNNTLNEHQICTLCGFDAEKNHQLAPHGLPAGTILNGQYIIGRVLGQGGFGITYTARDHQTGQIVAVKEFFPDSMVMRSGPSTVIPFTGERGENFDCGRSIFLQEAQTMAEFIGNPNIVRVFSYFEENGTAYFVMEYIDGVSFWDYLKSHGGKLSFDEALDFLFPVMDALSAVHEKGIIHRDVTPDNIYISNNGTVKLLDFGAARYSLGNVSRSLDVILKHGFAPKEQYKRRGRQGPYTDVYSLGATLYYAITGVRPDDAIERSDEDDLPFPTTLGAQITLPQEEVLLKAMAVDYQDRYQTVAEFKLAISELHLRKDGRKSVTPPSREAHSRQEKSEKSHSIPDEKSRKQKTTASDNTKSVHVSKPPRRRVLVPVLCMAAAVFCLLTVYAFGRSKGQKTLSVPTVETESPVIELPEETTPPATTPIPPIPIPPPLPTEPEPPSQDDLYEEGVLAFEARDFASAQEYFKSLSGYRDSDRYLRIIQIYNMEGKIAAGENHSCMVQDNGTVVSFGMSTSDRLKTDDWTNIVAVSVSDFTLGLRANGTVLVTNSSNDYCKVGDWKNIIDISAGKSVSAGLKSDGTVVIAGLSNYHDAVAKWSNIVDIACTDTAVFGLKSDGTVVTAGKNDGIKNCKEWTDIVAISGGHKHLLGLKKDGTVVATGSGSEGQLRVSKWTDIVAISAGYEHSVGLRADGTVVATGENLFKQCNVGDWENVVAIGAGRHHTLAIQADGTQIAVGSNSYGRCYPKD